MDDAEALGGMLSAKVNPGQFDLSRFGRPSGPADSGPAPPRGDKTAIQESTLAGLKAMLKEEAPPPPPVRSSRPRPTTPQIRETRPEERANLLESGDIMENTAFKFMVTVQELTEDGGFIGRGAGVGRIRVRGSEMGLYKRVGRGV